MAEPSSISYASGCWPRYDRSTTFAGEPPWAAIDNTLDHWFLPVAQAVLAALAQHAEPLVLVMDGSAVGRGGLALMLSVVYHGRALPLAWVVISSKKGHFAQAVHCGLLVQVQAMLPPTAQVVFVLAEAMQLGDPHPGKAFLPTVECSLADAQIATHFDSGDALLSLP